MQKRFLFTRVFLNLILTVSLLLPFLCSPQSIFASGATIALSPKNGIYEKQFTVDVVVDGGGQAFNAAQAIVNVSANLSIQNLVTGDCNFSFLKTPSIANPSFTGVLLGKKTQKCTVYTMTLAPITKGTTTVTITKATIQRFGDAVDILSETVGGTYTITGVVDKSSLAILPTIALPQENLYSVLITIQTKGSKPVTNTPIQLKSVTTSTPFQAKTDSNGKVQFTNLKSGMYDVLVTNYPGDHIINVVGNNHTLVLGITLQPQQNNIMQALVNPFVLIGMLLLGIIIGGSVVAGLVIWKIKKK
jgi:hypothetical protein